MNHLAGIPIRIEGPDAAGCGAADAVGTAGPGGLGQGVIAILSELRTLLARLSTRGEAAAIDLRSLPMTEVERDHLRLLLGRGEVEATIDAAGLSRVTETGVAGVWWVEHRDARGGLQAELLEVCRVPGILARGDDEIAAAGCALDRRMGVHG